jgi:hypothetical protein
MASNSLHPFLRHKFLCDSKKQWVESRLELWWAARESCGFNSSFERSYREQAELESKRWETEILPMLEREYQRWCDTLDRTAEQLSL